MTSESPEARYRIPALDGWRGVAIALVLWDHVQAAIWGLPPHSWQQTGQHGVTIFFVLSGFLITTTLIEKPIDLKSFYIRRFFRLMPVAWAYLGVLLLLAHTLSKTFAPPAAILASLFFYRNYLGANGGFSTLHFWSLSLEEQFYLIWPCLLLFAGIRRSRWIAGAGALACALYRSIHWSQYDRAFLQCQSQVRADALLIGCLMALLLASPQIKAIATRWSSICAFPAFGMLLYCIDRFHNLPPLTENVCIAALIAASMLHPKSILARPLTSRILTTLGVVSYSVYVWQELFMVLMPRQGVVSIVGWIATMALISLASYEYIERPFVRLGHRLTVRARTSGNATLSKIEVTP